MFDTNMTESQTGKVVIDDFEPAVVHEMLTFIYTGDAPNIEVHSADLLAAADKYQIEGLKVEEKTNYKYETF
jgi:speckle-type POZ protein